MWPTGLPQGCAQRNTIDTHPLAASGSGSLLYKKSSLLDFQNHPDFMLPSAAACAEALQNTRSDALFLELQTMCLGSEFVLVARTQKYFNLISLACKQIYETTEI
jgi:hypothetical protein